MENKKTLSLTLAVIVVALAVIMLSVIIWDNKIKTTEENQPMTNGTMPASEIINSELAENYDKDKIYTVEEFKKLNLPEEFLVNVKFEGNLCENINFRISEDYEGPGSGIYFKGLAISNDKDPKQISEICSLLAENKALIISGEIRYCGGKKIERSICGLRVVELKKTIK